MKLFEPKISRRLLIAGAVASTVRLPAPQPTGGRARWP